MEKFIENNYHKIFLNTNHDLKNYILEDTYELSSQKTFYVKEIKIKMKREVFLKILDNSHSFEKEYTPEDIFFVCNSYGFSFLDNHITILKNILYLIIEKKFKFDEINEAFFRNLSVEALNCKYYRKFLNQISENNAIDLQSQIDQFISDNYLYIKDDIFLNQLFKWKTALTNLFTLIQLKFCFHISIDENYSIMKIYHNNDTKYMIDLLPKNIDCILLILSDDCIFSFESFTYNAKLLLCKVFNSKRNLNIIIDITEFYIKLYKYEGNDLIHEEIQLHSLLSFLLINLKSPLNTNIGKNKILIEKNKNTGIITISKKNNYDLFIVDELILVSKKILFLKIVSILYLIKSIAEIIIADYINQIDKNINNVSITFNERRTQIKENLNILNFNISYNNLYYNEVEKDSLHIYIQTISFCGLENSGSQLIGLGASHQKYEDCDFVNGIFDDYFSLIQLSKISCENESVKESNFVSKMTNFFQAYEEIDSTLSYSNHYFDSYDNQHFDQEFLIFNLHSENTDNNLRKTSICPKVVCVKSNEKNLQFIEKIIKVSDMKKKSNTQTITIYHLFTSVKDENQLYVKETNKILLPKLNLESICCQISIERSNFHIIISRILELKSINRYLSCIEKKICDFEIKLKIIHCQVRFLTPNILIYNQIRFVNCEFQQKLQICYDDINHDFYQYTFDDSFYEKPIIVGNFIQIQGKIHKNFISYVKRGSKSTLIAFNSTIHILKKIPLKFFYISLHNCHLVSVENNCLKQNDLLLSRNNNSNVSLSNLRDTITSKLILKTATSILEISNCILSQNLRIIGIFNWILIKNCSSPFIINSYFRKLQIFNHKDQYSVSNIASRAEPIQPSNTLVFDENSLFLRNLIIDRLENIEINQIHILNCSIKTILNVKCKNIKILNTMCSFQLKIADQIEEYNDFVSDFVRFEKNSMILDSHEKFDNIPGFNN